MQTSQIGGQQYSDTSPSLVFPGSNAAADATVAENSKKTTK